ncbi:hypothetical protein A7X67_05960 [Clostridium sp. W14A]|nr:hypothetical protein A7X67_05960 [Clostridium sp. W14A]
MINSLFAALLWIVTLFRMIWYTQGFRAATEEAGRPLDLAYRLSELGFNVLFGLFLLVLGWFLAYGFAGLRFVLPAVFTALLISALIEFAFTPWSRAPWIFEGLRTIGAIFWCGAARFAFWAAQRHGDNLRRKKVVVSAFSILGVLLFFQQLTHTNDNSKQYHDFSRIRNRSQNVFHSDSKRSSFLSDAAFFRWMVHNLWISAFPHCFPCYAWNSSSSGADGIRLSSALRSSQYF